MRVAIKWYKENDSSASIFSDSQSALFAISNKYNLNPIATEIRSEIIKNGSHICLTWVRGHNGDTGNERADTLAKLAAYSDTPYSYSLCPLSFIKKTIKEHITEEWNAQWIRSDKGVSTREMFFPTVRDREKCNSLTPNFLLTQFLTGHGKFNNYLHRFRIKDSSQCICGNDSQTVTHLLFDCPRYLLERLEFELLLNTTDSTYRTPLTSVLTNHKSYKYFMEFINKIYTRL